MQVFKSESSRRWQLVVRRWAGHFGFLLTATLATAVQADSHTETINAILAKADTAYGEYLSGQCVTCHHAKGKSDGIPSILGLPDVYLVQTILEYKYASEERTNPTMVNIAKNLSDEEIGSLARFFSAQKAE
jgi:cytochrome c